MTLERTLTYTYEIDTDTLIEYLLECDEEDWSFDNFVDWIDEKFYWNDFEEDIDAEWQTVNSDFRVNERFLNELEKLKSKLEESNND